jgi:hypothetical protein
MARLNDYPQRQSTRPAEHPASQLLQNRHFTHHHVLLELLLIERTSK